MLVKYCTVVKYFVCVQIFQVKDEIIAIKDFSSNEEIIHIKS